MTSAKLLQEVEYKVDFYGDAVKFHYGARDVEPDKNAVVRPYMYYR